MHFPPVSFRIKTIMGIAAIEALLLVILIWNSLDFLKTSNSEQLSKRAITTAELFASASKDAVLSSDLATLDTFVQELLTNPGIKDGFGKVLSQGGNSVAMSRPFSVDTKVDKVGDGVYDVFADITESDVLFGRVELGLSVDSLRQLLLQARKQTSTIAIMELILSALFSFVLGTYLTRQLKSLSHASRQITEGRLGFEIPIKGRDELAQTADAFNRMSRRIKDVYDHLEARVAQRTVELAKMNATLREEVERRRKLTSAIEQSTDIVFVVDHEGLIEYVNAGFEKTTSYSRYEVLGKSPSILKSGQHDETFYRQIWETVTSGQIYQGTIVNRKKDGALYTEEKTIAPLRDEKGEITHFISTGKDITARIEVQRKLDYLAYHDTLTGLPNRSLCYERLAYAIAQAKRYKRTMALMFVDLDHFKDINNTMGHEAGDSLLQETAKRLKKCVRDSDTIARLGGDEFTLILSEINQPQDVAVVADRIVHAFLEPISLVGQNLHVTASIGIAIFPEDGSHPEALMKAANRAIYSAKENGRNNCVT